MSPPLTVFCLMSDLSSSCCVLPGAAPAIMRNVASRRDTRCAAH